MEKWIEHIQKHTLSLDESNPHLHNEDLLAYLSFYSFHMDRVHTYRCGFVPSAHFRIFTQLFSRKKAKGLVVLVHGYLDHAGGLSKTVNHLLEDGYDVLTLDLPGHGMTEGGNGSIRTFDEYVQAIIDVCETSTYYVKQTTIIGMGHSTGAAMLFHTACQNKIKFDRLIFVAPLFMPFRWTLVKGIIKAAGKVRPRSRRRFKRNSADRTYHSFIKKDPLQSKWLHADWLLAMEAWQSSIENCLVYKNPVYLIQGTKDTTVEWPVNIRFFRKKCKNIQVMLLPEGRHQLLNERGLYREIIMERISQFLRQSVK
ncbi:alpha/beta hydrolase [Paenalkalicoccus suaedae]|uniref:Alpha/beta hydrolase n=1 Tax=Paenalkalicoccus suaedae TaxID=2592382 RepID=A0A859FFE0_9BACI|nr:alpha/beta hydrolase [Paenalkalicoccus suaedae]QKS71314.1 alpha/beta hydrolase [Paenalkalicoccus suaedae]